MKYNLSTHRLFGVFMACCAISTTLLAQNGKQASNSTPNSTPNAKAVLLAPLEKARAKQLDCQAPAHATSSKDVAAKDAAAKDATSSKDAAAKDAAAKAVSSNGLRVGPPDPNAPFNIISYIPKYDDITFDARAVNQTLPVGTVAGQHDVSGAGVLTYNIPIQLPPGTNGVIPSLSIAYNSQAPNGHLGLGWVLAGLSTIIRDGHRKIFEGDASHVVGNNNDAFSLDGEHLKPITGSNGNDGSVYDTYITSFSKIISHGDMGGSAHSPQWFEITTKDGAVMEYGNTTDSRYLGALDVPIMWRLNRVTDVHGNFIEFVYETGAAPGATERQPRILEIHYTGNNAQGLLPYNKI
ncbi:MAG: hypothetical protein RI894_1104, partial [Bacteroidota bacterium]